MRLTLLVLVLALSGLVIFGVIKSSSKIQQPATKFPTKNQLQWRADKAKNEGKQKVQISSPIVEYLGSFGDMNELLTSHSVVIAQPVEQRTYPDGNDVLTWYRFSILESLTKLKPPVCFDCQSAIPPHDMLPLKSGEFLLSKYGGKILIDGVEIEQIDAGYPDFRQGEKYVLVISLYPSGVAISAGGPTGIFKVAADDLTPLNDSTTPLKEGVKTKFGNSLKSLKEHFQRQLDR